MATVMTRRWRRKDDASSGHFLQPLKSNNHPTEEESQRIRALIHALDAELAALLSKKTQGARRFWAWRRRSLDRRIKRLTEQVRRYTSVLSIIRAIPVEIIQYIFLLSETNPWILSRVCRDWRRYAQSFPPLWARLPRITITPKLKKRTAATLRRCIEMLRYSSNAPLTVSIQSYSRNEKVVNDPSLNLLALHAHRWHRAKILLPVATMANLPHAIKGHLSNLQSLWLSFTYVYYDPSVNFDIDTFADTPRLRSLHIEGGFSGNIEVTAPDLAHLTCSWPLPFSVSALSRFTRLESLYLSATFSLVESASLPTHRLIFPHLKQLSADLSGDHSVFLLRSIVVSSVTEIILKLPPANAIAHTIAMLIQSDQQISPSVRHFQLRTEAAPEAGQTIALLRLMPELRTLEISMPHFDDINAFAQTNDPLHILVPNLETCTFFFETMIPAARPSAELRSAINAMTLSRCEAPCGISSSWKPDDLRPLRLFELGGLYRTCPIPSGANTQFQPTKYLPLFTQADFENWTPTHRLWELVHLHDRLVEQIPLLYGGILNFGKPFSVWVPIVNAILDEVEALEGPDPFDVLTSNLHILIEKLTAKPTGGFRKSVSGELSFPQADRIFSNWKALIAPHLDQTHWVYTDLGYGSAKAFMVYVKSDDAIRASEHMKEAVLGNDDDSAFGNKGSYLSSMTLKFRHHSGKGVGIHDVFGCEY